MLIRVAMVFEGCLKINITCNGYQLMLLRNVFSANFLVQCQHANASYRHSLHYFLLCKYLTEYF
jgi:hypothetical protein